MAECLFVLQYPGPLTTPGGCKYCKERRAIKESYEITQLVLIQERIDCLSTVPLFFQLTLAYTRNEQ